MMSYSKILNRTIVKIAGRNIPGVAALTTSSSLMSNRYDNISVWQSPSFPLITVCSGSSGSSSTYNIKRWKHSKGGKMGHRVEKLNELAHRPEREAAQERRKRKKERKLAKRGDSTKGTEQLQETTSDSAVFENEIGNDDYDDIETMLFDDDDVDEQTEDENKGLPDPAIARRKMDAVVYKFKESLKSIRGSEATPEMFDDVTVLAYGTPTPLNAIAQVVISTPTLANISCFDPQLAKDVVKAVQLTLELNPQMDEGGNIRVKIPRVSMEVRENLSKSVKKRAESCKKRLRGLRRKFMDDIKKGKDGKIPGVSKDDAFSSGKEIEAVSESVMETLNSIVKEKMDSIMAI